MKGTALQRVEIVEDCSLEDRGQPHETKGQKRTKEDHHIVFEDNLLHCPMARLKLGEDEDTGWRTF